jgi:uncharacterized repeat protein (TIGR03803 family)
MNRATRYRSSIPGTMIPRTMTFGILAVLSALLLIAARPVQAQTEAVLYNFGSRPDDGYYPYAGLTFDKKGNLYGTTSEGGAYSDGTVFEVTKDGTEKILYSFGSQAGDGAYPFAGLIFDKEGNLYGTTYEGGAYGDGTVFELTAAGTETVLYSFGSQTGDGTYPFAGLIFDKKGNLYGTTINGGAYGGGTVFELTAAGAEKVLYSFGSQAGDGARPYAGLTFGKKGNLYGTTKGGGSDGSGTVFELTAAGTEKVLHSFSIDGGDGDGYFPYAGVTFDKTGNLYSTTYAGGAYDHGTVFELTPGGTEKILYSFGSQTGDGYYPDAGLVFDKTGNLYGTTSEGGAYGKGTVIELAAAGTEKVLYSFVGQTGDGCLPYFGSLIFDKKGNLYGTTIGCGAETEGTVFKLVP